MSYEEAERALIGSEECNYYAEDLKKSEQFRAGYKKRKGVVRAEEMPWENSPQGRIKHMVSERMNTRECCIDEYQQLLPPGGRSGKHRHMAEEILFVLEGKGYDLHWDMRFDCQDEYSWSWAEEPRRFDWEEADIVYIPPFTTHQHFNADAEKPARFISASNRVVKAMGFDWLDQVETAPDYKP
jgi:quercetin dioxygenase-like cupin family protein